VTARRFLSLVANMPDYLNIALANTTSNNLFAYITGRSGDSICLIQADGRTPYFPASPAVAQSPVPVDCAIRVPPGTTTITIPKISAARVWFSVDEQLRFLLNPGPGLVEPSVTNPADPNINTLWGFCELTFNDFQLYANISYVDFVSLPIAMTLTNSSGHTQVVQGMSTDGLERVCHALQSQASIDGKSWDKLVVKTPSGKIVRALSPNLGLVMNSSLFANYYEPYVDAVWNKYTNTPLTINTQSVFGTVEGRVVDGVLQFPGVGSFKKPSTRDIFTCDSGSFLTDTPGMRALTPRVSAAFNRSTLLTRGIEPSTVDTYYREAVTHHYSRILHEVNLDKRGYAFPYDDVAPDGGIDQSGSVFDPNPSLLTITIGGGGVTAPPVLTTDAASRIQAESYATMNGVAIENTSDVDGGQNIGWVSNGDWIGFNNVDFHTGMNMFTIRVASGAGAGISGLVELHLDDIGSAPVAKFSVANTGGWQTWRTLAMPVSDISGVHSVYLTFSSGQAQDFVNVNWFTFSNETPDPAPVTSSKRTIWSRVKKIFKK
jgi:hypothetical protein